MNQKEHLHRISMVVGLQIRDKLLVCLSLLLITTIMRAENYEDYRRYFERPYFKYFNHILRSIPADALIISKDITNDPYSVKRIHDFKRSIDDIEMDLPKRIHDFKRGTGFAVKRIHDFRKRHSNS
ncbi:hypothetical protein ACOME3_002418 [Neoechinorhynchus agilis]